MYGSEGVKKLCHTFSNVHGMFHHWCGCLSCQSGMTPIIAFGLILGLSFFNKLDMNPAQVNVSSVSKCIELRIISEV